MRPVILNLARICFGYPGGPMILNHLDFHTHEWDRIGLVAPNGMCDLLFTATTAMCTIFR